MGDITTQSGEVDDISVLDTVEFNPFVTTEEEGIKHVAARQLQEAQAYQAAVHRYPQLRRSQDGSAASSVITTTTSTSEWRDAYNAYYNPEPGTAECSYPRVDIGQPVQNSTYLAICVSKALTKLTVLPALHMTATDIKSQDKMTEFITVCIRHNLHPFIRWSMIAESARK